MLVALNGKFAAVGVVEEHDGAHAFGALLSPQFFIKGKNELRVFRVRWKAGDAVELKELEVRGAS